MNPENRPLVDDKCITTDSKKIGSYALEYLWTDSRHIDPKTLEFLEAYTYGSRLTNIDGLNQIEESLKLLAEDPNNRQVTLTIRIPSDINETHPPCMTVIDFDVEANLSNKYCGESGKKVYFIHPHIYFRSWDAYAGLPENIAGLQVFMEAYVDELNSRCRDKYFFTGMLIFSSKNTHIYQRQYELVKTLVEPKIEEEKHKEMIIQLIKEHKEKQYHEFP
jgi:thymidylate synthase